MSLHRTYYQILGVPPDAKTEQIQTKYRELARKFHPDVAADKAFAETIFAQINEAYSTLRRPERRAAYDRFLQDAAPSPPAPAPLVAPGPTLTRVLPPFSAADYLAQAARALQQGRYDDCRACCRRLLEREPENAKALELLGDLASDTGHREEAAALYRRALRSSPSALAQSKLHRLEPPPPPSGQAAPGPVRNRDETDRQEK